MARYAPGGAKHFDAVAARASGYRGWQWGGLGFCAAWQPAARLAAPIQTTGRQRPVIIPADEPGEDDALAARRWRLVLQQPRAAPEVLRQVATVIENGGLWVGQRLMQRLSSGTARLVSPPVVEGSGWAETLTEREREVALAVAQGASNKEIARQLTLPSAPSRRTLAPSSKNSARDRLQLSSSSTVSKSALT